MTVWNFSHLHIAIHKCNNGCCLNQTRQSICLLYKYYLNWSQGISLPLILHTNRQGITDIQSMEKLNINAHVDGKISFTGRKSSVSIGQHTQGYRILSAGKEVGNHHWYRHYVKIFLISIVVLINEIPLKHLWIIIKTQSPSHL